MMLERTQAVALKFHDVIFALSSAALVAGVSGCGPSDRMGGTPSVLSTPAPSSMPEAISSAAIAVGSKSHAVMSCNLETVNGQSSEGIAIEVQQRRPVTISGWVIDEKARKVPDNVRLKIQSSDGRLAWEQAVAEWADRSDVADRRGRSYLSSGFAVTMNLSELPEGRYGYYLAYETASGEIVCGVGRQIVLTK